MKIMERLKTPILTKSVPSLQVVLYHADCPDGFGAAWALWKRFPQATFIPVKHGKEPPAGLQGQHVMMVDFSYPRDIIEGLADRAASLHILDHHITAQQALSGLSYAHFEMNKSGAVLAWEWAHAEPVPWLLQYIQDKDLWTWQLPNSREINAALASYPYDFEAWNSLKQDVLEVEGRAILRYESALIGNIVSEAVFVSFEGEVVPAVYSPVLNSQIGERFCQDYPFCIIWHQKDGRRYFSLRSRRGTDVSVIATKYGGGGHVNAAGFSIPIDSETDLRLNPLSGLVLPT